MPISMDTKIFIRVVTDARTEEREITKEVAVRGFIDLMRQTNRFGGFDDTYLERCAADFWDSLTDDHKVVAKKG